MVTAKGILASAELSEEALSAVCRDLFLVEQAGLWSSFMEAYIETVNRREWQRFDPQGEADVDRFAGRVADLLGQDLERCRRIARQTLLTSRTAAILAVASEFAERARCTLARRDSKRERRAAWQRPMLTTS